MEQAAYHLEGVVEQLGTAEQAGQSRDETAAERQHAETWTNEAEEEKGAY